MNLYLSVGKNYPHGYVHLDPSPKDGKFIMVKDFVTTLYALLNDTFNSCSSIIVDNVYKYIPHNDKQDFIKACYNLLESGGKLIVSDRDFIEMLKLVLCGEISISEINNNLYRFSSVDELYNVIESLKVAGFTIIDCQLNNTEFVVECKK